MHRHRPLFAIIGVTGLLAACGDADEPDGGIVEAAAESGTSTETTQTTFSTSLESIGTDWTIAEYVRFVHQSRINELEGSDKQWKELGAHRSALTLPYFPQPETLLGLDLGHATTVISTGGLSDGNLHGVSLTSGGQDTTAVEDRALNSGWIGESPLFRYAGDQPNIPQGLQVLLVGDHSVATGNPDTNMDVVGGLDPTLAEQGHIGELAECLGDPVAAAVHYRIRPDATDDYAVGVIVGDDGKPRSVVCSWFQNAYTAERVGDKTMEDIKNGDIRGDSEFAGRRHNELFDHPSITVKGTVLRTELEHKDGTPIDTILTLGDDWSAPGIS